MPLWSSPRPSSLAEHSMPSESMPRMPRRSISHAVGHVGAERGERDDVAGLHVERAAPHVALGAVAGVDVDAVHLRGVGCVRCAAPRGDHAGDRLADVARRRRRRGRARSGVGTATAASDVVAEVAYSLSQESRIFRIVSPVRTARGSGCRWCTSRGGRRPVAHPAMRSMPNPNANPLHSSGSIPPARSTLGCTMPQPPSSSQSPSGRWMSNSADGSVNGKYDGRRREVKSPPKNALVNASIVPARSAIVIPGRPEPSIWWKTGMWVASGCHGGTRGRGPRCRSAVRRLEHRADLDGRRVGAQHVRARSAARGDVVDEQGVELAACRVPLAHVERLEVVPVGLDLGALGDLEAEADEHVLEPLPRLGDDVGVPRPGRPRQLGEVEPLGLDAGGECLGGQRRPSATWTVRSAAANSPPAVDSAASTAWVASLSAWPATFLSSIDDVILTTVERLQRKGGREIVGRCLERDDARNAADWIVDRISRLEPTLAVSADVESGGGQYLVVLRAS
jgi:hypothetical protein